MIVFKYQVQSVDQCRTILDAMNLPGRFEVSEDMDSTGSKIVFEGDHFLGLFHPKDQLMELYGTKNTNSINYYINRYESLDWDTWQCVKTKRWS